VRSAPGGHVLTLVAALLGIGGAPARADAQDGVPAGAATGGATAVAPPARLPVAGSSACPRPEAVTSALGALGADWRELAAGLPDAGPLATIVDLGGSYRVTIAGRSRDYADPRRDCDERARVAAVVVTLMVDALASSARREAPVAVKAPPPPPAPPPPRHAPALEAGLTGALGAAPGGDFGAGVRAAVAFRRGPFALVAAAGASAPHTLALGPVQARLLRFPAALAVRLSGGDRRAELGVELGAAAALSVIENENPATPTRQVRSELGIHAALVARLAPSRSLSPLIGLGADLFPVSYAYAADPLGDVGRAARLWFSAWIGIAYDLR
jgi:hypothetical protein